MNHVDQTCSQVRTDGFGVLQKLLPDEVTSDLSHTLDKLTLELRADTTQAPSASANIASMMRRSSRENVVFPGQEAGHVSRVGHRLERVSAVIRLLTMSPLCTIVEKLLQDPVVVAAALICKHPGSFDSFSPHRDTWFLHPDDDELLALAVPLDPARQLNGGLVVFPGSHVSPTKYRVALDADGWQQARPGPQPSAPDNAVNLDLQVGDVAVFHGRLWHGSPTNTGPTRRRLLIIQLANGASTWPASSWRTPPFVRLSELT